MPAPVVTNGALLVKRLKEIGTPDAKLAPARAKLIALHADRGLVASADEVIAALEDAFGPDHMTVVKARSVRDTGTWVPPPPAAPVSAIEDMLAGADLPESSGPPTSEPGTESAPAGKVQMVLSPERTEGAEPPKKGGKK